ncbi:response regulator transcription factor [Colwellia demingiae]|uniref:Response regulator transcription factor n=1 Tax=Colwellia demingiae TaxID=89401 RepID=A0A5C6Q6H5_9GAMM|nr:response regulator transcription factor [Colwellia demingiae]TWX64565.1 response regulator transcription factor [Colwellia demingiae]
MRILLVEDDQGLAEALQQSLVREGFVVDHLSRGKLALTALAVPSHDMVILDLGLPDIDGLVVLKEIRAKKNDLPVIILTARDSIDSKVKGLDYGADDYLAKPFDMQELLARLRVIERRLGTSSSSMITIDRVSLDTKAHKVFLLQCTSANELPFEQSNEENSEQKDKVDAQNSASEVHFSKKEFMVLKALMENAGRIQSREQIESKLYHWGEEVLSNAVEVHIHKLRKNLPNKFIQNVRGVGYIINHPQD